MLRLPSPTRSACAAALWLAAATATAQEAQEAEAGEVEEEEEMVVTGTRTAQPRGESPVPVEVITREDILASGAEDLAEVLDGVPGVDVQWSYLGASVRMHGLEPEHVLFLVDGARQIGRKDGVLDLSRYPVEEIERVEIVKGAAAAQYGSDAVGGVVHVITRAPEGSARWQAGGRARYGSHSTADVTADLTHRGVRLGAGWHQTDGYDLDPTDLTTDGAARQGFDVSGRSRLRLGAGSEAALGGQYTRRAPTSVEESATGAIYDVSNVTEDFQVRLAPSWVLGDRARLTVQGGVALFRDQYLRDQRESSAEDQYEDTRQQQGDASVQLDRLLGEAHTLSVGLDGLVEGLESPRLSEVGGRARGGVFAQDAWRLGQWTLLPGARWDGDTQFGGQLSPKVAVRWAPGEERVVLRAGYGHGYRAPGFRELLLRFDNPSVGYVVTGSTDLEPERSRGATLDADIELHPRLGVQAGLFWDRVDDLITIELADEAVGLDTYQYANVEAARSRGGEAAATFRWGRVKLTGSYTFTDATDLELGAPLSGRARHRGTASARLPVPFLRLSLYGRVSLTGPQVYADDADGDGQAELSTSPAYANLDVRAAARLTEALSLLVGASNLLDAGEGVFLPPPPRMIYAGLTFRRPAPASPDPEPELAQEDP